MSALDNFINVSSNPIYAITVGKGQGSDYSIANDALPSISPDGRPIPDHLANIFKFGKLGDVIKNFSVHALNNVAKFSPKEHQKIMSNILDSLKKEPESKELLEILSIESELHSVAIDRIASHNMV